MAGQAQQEPSASVEECSEINDAEIESVKGSLKSGSLRNQLKGKTINKDIHTHTSLKGKAGQEKYEPSASVEECSEINDAEIESVKGSLRSGSVRNQLKAKVGQTKNAQSVSASVEECSEIDDGEVESVK